MRTALILSLFLPLPAAAQTFAVPQGCEAYLTVQKRGCTVSHHFICAADPEGYQRRVDLGEEGELLYAGVIDAETQWIESWHPLAGTTDRLAPGAPDPASFSTLIDTGLDSFEFSVLSDNGFETVFRGQDRLTGETVTIDGIALERTEFSVKAYDTGGALIWEVTGNEFISRDWRMFLSGTRTTVTADETWSDNGTPMAFIFPGEDGFLSSTPRHDCGAMLSKLPF